MLWLRPDFATALPPTDDAFETVMNLQGEIFKRKKAHRTLRFELAGRAYFLKAHTGVGWWDIVEDLLRLRLPMIGARTEWLALQRLAALDIATTTLAGYGQRGRNPAQRRSFVVTDALLDTISLENYCKNWDRRPPVSTVGIRFKRALIAEVARIARALHSNGINHRDFYLCHFLLDQSQPDAKRIKQPPRLLVIDLHRAQLRRTTPKRWIIKDIGSLFFSSMAIGLNRRDLLRFIRAYRQCPLRESLGKDRALWRAVDRRARRMYRSFHGTQPPLYATD